MVRRTMPASVASFPARRHRAAVPRNGSGVSCKAQQPSKATVTENRSLTLDASVRELTLAVHDPVDYLSGRRMTPKALNPRWLDDYLYPGQKVELTTHEGVTVPVAICSSPSESRRDSGVGNFSVIRVVVERESESRDLINAQPEETFSISRIHGPGFSNPVNDDIKLTSVLEEKRPILIVARGASGIGTARSAICWDALAASATECPVVVTYIAESKESAAFILEWDSWKARGVHFIPIYVSEEGTKRSESEDGGNSTGGSVLLPQQDRFLLHMEALLSKGGPVAEIMKNQLQDATAMFSGLSPEEFKSVLRYLKSCKIRGEHILYS